MGDQAIYVAASGAIVQQMKLEVLTNNLANINTIGFKEDRAVFNNYIPQIQKVTMPATGEDEISTFAAELFTMGDNYNQDFEGTKTNYSSGPLNHTGNSLDFALEGDGFFCVQTQNGLTHYTRKGNFTRNEEGMLSTYEGLPVLGENENEIIIEGETIQVDEEGNVSVDNVTVGKIKIVDFDRPYSLQKAGDTLFYPADETVREIDAENIKVMQGFIEMSNVDAVKTMTEMIEVNRAFETYQRIIKNLDEVVSKSINEVGKTV